MFSGLMSQLETDRWIQNMEGHMEYNTIARKDMAQHALRCFERGASTWWRMYQTINGWQGATTWKEFKLSSKVSVCVPEVEALWKGHEETLCMQDLWRNRTHP